MIPTSGSPFAWAFGVSIVIHIALIGLLNFEPSHPEKDHEEKVINIALTQEPDITRLDQDSLQPLPTRKDQDFVERNQTTPEAVAVPLSPEHTPLQKEYDKPSNIDNAHLLTDLASPPKTEATHVPLEKQFLQPETISDVSNQIALVSPPLIKPRQFARNTTQQQILDNTIPSELINSDSLAQIPEPVQPFTKIPTSLEPTSELASQAKPIQTDTIKMEPPESKTTDQPLVAMPPIPPSPARAATNSQNSEEDLNSSSEGESSATLAARSEYIRALHNTLNKRAQRKYPRKAIQNCIQGTVRVQIKISPTGEQLSYQISNPGEADPILQRAAEKLLDGKKDYLSFAEEISTEAITFQVNLVYSLPHCQ